MPEFWDLHRAPPEYPCAQPATTCAPLGPSEWVCGPFSPVRAMRQLALMLDDAGLPAIAASCASSSAGHIEARINEELALAQYGEDKERWFLLNALKMAARNIRKWGIEP